MPPRPKKQGPIEVTAAAAAATPSPGSKRQPKASASRKAHKETVATVQSDTTQSAATASRAKTRGKGHDAANIELNPFYHDRDLTREIKTAQDKWSLLPAYLQVKGLVKQHIDSFNFFISHELKKIIAANRTIYSDVNDKFFLYYKDIRVLPPCRLEEELDFIRDPQGYYGKVNKIPVHPNECRLRDMTYAAPVVVDIEYKMGNRKQVKTNVPIARLPVMLRSKICVLAGKSERQHAYFDECPVDPGGYFIVRGQEKAILVQEQLSKNRIIVESGKGIIQASVTSSTHERKSKSYVLLKKDRLYFRHNVFSEDIPVVIMLKAMGMQSDRDILVLVAGTDEVYQDNFAINFDEMTEPPITTQQQALEYIGTKVKIMRTNRSNIYNRKYQREAIEALASVVLTHVAVENLDFRPKALYLAYMTRRVLMAMHDPLLVDDRDYVGNKRLELAGQMLSLLFEDHFKRFNVKCKDTIDKELMKKNMTQAYDASQTLMQRGHSEITMGIERAISTGNWNLRRFRMDRAGVAHVLSRLSYISALGMLTRITSQFEKTRKISGPRALQTSQFGMLCPADTPEGESCGLIKNLALMTHVTTDDTDSPIRQLVFVLGAEDISTASGVELYSKGMYLIFINGTPVAMTRQPHHFLRGFRVFRRTGRISEFVSVFINHHHHAVHIASDEGRICRPLIIVEKGKSKLQARHLDALRKGTMVFDDFLARGIVEYLDVNEENDSGIAIYERDITDATTHLEIEPFTMLGAVAGLIPYPHHNQSPRNTYQCAMGKQAMGTIGYNQQKRLDTLLYTMVYPQRPLVTTRTIELIKYDKLPAGQNAIVAVMSYTGYDIEDALILNKASCDRGFGRCQVFRKIVLPIKKYPTGHKDRLADRNEADARQNKIGRDGIVDVGMRLDQNDIYAVKQIPLHQTSSLAGSESGSDRDNWQAVPQSYRLPDHCYVDQVVATATEGDTETIKIQTRQTRRPEVGDKFSSRHGQKGVVGLIAEQVDMPFTDDGLVPDVVMNPHGFPSRMTVGKMLELLAGKAAVAQAPYEFKYGTAFGGTPIEEIATTLQNAGYSFHGKDYLTSGITGEPLPAYIFFGPVYYQKLKHMVQDKMHARARGPLTTLTRQPTEGRSRDGGLRLGEMERDCLIAYGASQLLLERLMLSSDAHVTDLCANCGLLGHHGWCPSCRSSKAVLHLTIPYAAKLLISELMAMGVKATMRLEPSYGG